jgi:hypothetical protein
MVNVVLPVPPEMVSVPGLGVIATAGFRSSSNVMGWPALVVVAVAGK